MSNEANDFVADMLKITGVEDITLHFDENVAYLKVDNQLLDKKHLQGLMAQYLNT